MFCAVGTPTGLKYLLHRNLIRELFLEGFKRFDALRQNRVVRDESPDALFPGIAEATHFADEVVTILRHLRSRDGTDEGGEQAVAEDWRGACGFAGFLRFSGSFVVGHTGILREDSPTWVEKRFDDSLTSSPKQKDAKTVKHSQLTS